MTVENIARNAMSLSHLKFHSPVCLGSAPVSGPLDKKRRQQRSEQRKNGHTNDQCQIALGPTTTLNTLAL